MMERYGIDIGPDPGLYEREDGDWVLYEDVAALGVERDNLLAALEQLAHVADAYADQLDLAKVDVLGPTNRDVLRSEIAKAVKIIAEVRR